MTRFLRLFLVVLLTAFHLSIKAEDRSGTVEVDGVWYSYYYYDDDRPTPARANVICPPEGNKPYSGDIVLKDFIEVDGIEYWCNDIDEDAFMFSDITSIYIPNSYFTIGSFEGCKYLQNVKFDCLVDDRTKETYTNLSSYGYYKDCISLREFTLPCNMGVPIYLGGFEGCTSLTSVNFNNNNIWCIGGRAFAGCTNLRNFYMPSFIKDENEPYLESYIGTEAFADCINLESVVLSEGLNDIGPYAFSNCESLREIYCRDSEEPIDSPQYSVCLPKSVTKLYHGAFNGCISLRSIHLSSSITELDCEIDFGSPFYGCPNLNIIDVDENNPNYASVDGVLFSKDLTKLYQFAGSNITSYKIPESVERIYYQAFEGFRNLKEVSFNEGLKEIGAFAFRYTGINTVELREGTESIYSHAFDQCPLEKVILPESVSKIGSNAFYQFFPYNIKKPFTVITYSTTPPRKNSEYDYSSPFSPYPEYNKLYVPKGCKEVYQNANGYYDLGWHYCFTIYEMGDADGIDKTMNEGMKYSIAGDYLSIDNADNGTAVSIYGLDGKLLTSDIVRNGATNINISKHKGRVAILRIGNKKHKVVL